MRIPTEKDPRLEGIRKAHARRELFLEHSFDPPLSDSLHESKQLIQAHSCHVNGKLRNLDFVGVLELFFGDHVVVQGGDLNDSGSAFIQGR